jgi:hypothetical protein
MSTSLQTAILTFVSLLRSSWLQVYELGRLVPGREASEYVSDWAQASWEMLVEAAVSPRGDIYLEPYGEGADCNDVGSRVWRPGMPSTHAVHIVPSQGRELLDNLTGTILTVPAIGLPLDQFVMLSDNGWYRSEPPFDRVLIHQESREKVVSIDEVDFLLVEISD